MSGNEVLIKFSADAKEVQKSLDQMKTRLDRAQQRLEKMALIGRQSSKYMADGFNRSGRSVSGMSTNVGGLITRFIGLNAAVRAVQTTIRAVNDELEATSRKQNAALDATMGPAAAVRLAKWNFGSGDKTMRKEDFEPAILKLAKEKNAPVEVVAAALTDALSAKGSSTYKQVFDAVGVALEVDPNNPEFAKTLAGGFLDIAKFSGEKDAQKIAGLLLQTQAASRVTDPGKVGANLLPGIAGLVAKGDTPEQAAELVSALTQVGFENEGRITTNASISLGGQIMDYLPDRATKGKNKGRLVGKNLRGEEIIIPDAQFAAFEAESSPSGRVRVMQQSPELREAFIGASSFEKKAEEPVRQMLRGTEKALKEWKNTQRLINAPGEETKQFYESQLKFANSGDLYKNLNAEQETRAREELYKLGNTPSQRFAFARKTVKETLENIDRPGYDSPLNTLSEKALETSFKMSSSELAKGKRIGPPEAAAARVLEMVNTEGGLLGDEMSASDKQFLKEQIEFLKRTAKERGNITPEGYSPAFWERVRSGNDPQMDEQTNILREISTKLDQPTTPRQTERRSSRLSRGSN